MFAVPDADFVFCCSKEIREMYYIYIYALVLTYFAHLVCVCIYCIMGYYGEGMASMYSKNRNKQTDRHHECQQ